MADGQINLSCHHTGLSKCLNGVPGFKSGKTLEWPCQRQHWAQMHALEFQHVKRERPSTTRKCISFESRNPKDIRHQFCDSLSFSHGYTRCTRQSRCSHRMLYFPSTHRNVFVFSPYWMSMHIACVCQWWFLASTR